MSTKIDQVCPSLWKQLVTPKVSISFFTCKNQLVLKNNMFETVNLEIIFVVWAIIRRKIVFGTVV